MIYAIIAIILFLIAVGVYFFIRKKKAQYKDVKKEQMVFVALMIFAIIFMVLFFFGLRPTLQNPIGLPNIAKEIVIDSKVVLISPSVAKKCGENYCFGGEISEVLLGDFSVGETITIETDCPFQTYGSVEVSGEKNVNGILTECSNLVEASIDIEIYEIINEGPGGPQ